MKLDELEYREGAIEDGVKFPFGSDGTLVLAIENRANRKYAEVLSKFSKLAGLGTKRKPLTIQEDDLLMDRIRAESVFLGFEGVEFSGRVYEVPYIRFTNGKDPEVVKVKGPDSEIFTDGAKGRALLMTAFPKLRLFIVDTVRDASQFEQVIYEDELEGNSGSGCDGTPKTEAEPPEPLSSEEPAALTTVC